MGCAPSQPNDVAPIGDTPPGDYQQPKRQDSVHSLRSNGSSRRSGTKKGSTPLLLNDAGLNHRQNGGTNGELPPPSSGYRYLELWKTHQQLLLDPADIHATMEACMARMTNALSPTQVTFLQRKVRSIVRASSQSQEKAGSRMFRGGSNASQEQETKAIADKYHLLTKHVVRKVLPKQLIPPGETDQHDQGKIRAIVRLLTTCFSSHCSFTNRFGIALLLSLRRLPKMSVQKWM